jgi:hypothetical protein
VNLGMKPIEAKRTVDAVIAADPATQNPETIIRKSLAVLLGEK